MALTIKPLYLGKLHVNFSLKTYMMNFDKEIWLPIVSWYIRVKDKHVLVDTGAPAAIVHKYWHGGGYEEITTLEAALATVSLTPQQIDMVIITHLHFDHCGNLPKCKNAEVIVQADELEFARNPHPMFISHYLRDGELDGVNFREVEGDAELLPGIKVLKVPGHSPGTQAVAVETAAGTAIITGFCAIAENFSPPEEKQMTWPVVAPGVHTDALASFDSAVRLKEMADIVIPVHDMKFALKQQIP